MRLWEYFLILVIFIALGFFAYFLYSILPGKTELLVPTYPNGSYRLHNLNEEANFSQSKQFYDNLRFPTNVIRYKIDSDCPQQRIDSMNYAFKYFEDRTPLKFEESGDYQLEVVCSELAPKPEIANHFIAGEGGPTEIVNSTLYSVILSAKISLYKESHCPVPHITVHELLHVLGYDHNNNPKSILYPTLDCSQTVDQYFVDQLNELYSVPGRPDLKITFANATKNGPYLSFGIEVANQGLTNAKGVVLSLESDGKTIKDFSLEDIEIGTRKVLSVSNFRMSRSAQQIRFFVDKNDTISELDEENNFVDLNIKTN